MSHRKFLTVLIGLPIAVAIIIPALSYASGEHAYTGPFGGAHNIPITAINPVTCHFLVPESDPANGNFAQLRTYTLYEDARHDAKMACLTNRKPPKAPAPPRLDYQRVMAVGTGQTVTVACPAGFLVTGGGSQSEVSGSYPATDDSWTVTRDPKSPATLGVSAVCVRLVP